MIIFSLCGFIALYFFINYSSKKKFFKVLKNQGVDTQTNSVQIFHRMNNYGMYISIISMIISFFIFIFGTYLANVYTFKQILPEIKDNLIREITIEKIKSISHDPSAFKNTKEHLNIGNLSEEEIFQLAQKYDIYTNISNISIFLFCCLIAVISLFFMSKKISINTQYQKKVEKLAQLFILICSTIAIFTTFGIVISLCLESFRFFTQINIFNFLFGINWTPETADLDPQHSFGIIPLLVGTFMIAFLSVSFALPLGILSAVYMSEYMTIKRRKIIQPILESLAGIPSIVYGFFAATTVSQLVIKIGDFFDLQVSTESALPVSIVISVMILPFISSTILEVLDNIPKHVREGAYGMGSMKHEVILKILIPGSLPGIVAGTLLAVSRAVGESMVIVMAASIIAKLSINPLAPVTTITGQIVTIMKGDQSYDSPQMLSAFALGLTLFVITLLLNLMAMRIVNSHNKKYN